MKKQKRTVKWYLIRYLYLIFLLTIFVVGIVAGLFYYYSNELPPLSDLHHYDMKVGSEVYDRNNELIHVFAFEHRRLARLHEIPDHLIETLLAVEDTNFYNHWGMDQMSLVRALYVDLKHRRFSQGGSTITQQLARNLFLSLDKQIPRKIKELMLAIRIEKNFSKDEILEMYLNKVYFGAGMYGIEAASQRFFGKEAKDLTIEESALLVGLIQLPNAYSPIYHPERAYRRRNIVLNRMHNVGVISDSQYVHARQDTIRLYSPRGDRGAADYFIEYIRRYLEPKYGTNRLFAGGMKIYTTLDMELQQHADSVLNRSLIDFENRNDYEVKYEDFPADTVNIKTEYVQGGVFTIEPETGYVRAMIGGRNFNHSKLNRMTQSRRQAGSAFKPILYTAALNEGFTPATVIKDEPVSYIQSDTLFWNPKNYSRRYYGYTRMREAVTYSRNVYAAKLIYDIGARRVIEFARRFGLTTPLYNVYSIAIGTNEVIPMELISAFTTFANNGERAQPIFIRRVEDDDGQVLESAEIERIRVVNDQVAYLMTSMLQSVIEEGTGAGVRWRGYRLEGAGKTGTTDGYRDAWFIGFNKQLVTGVWVGFDDNTSLGQGQSGATAALPAWPSIMQKAIELDSPKNSKGEPIIDGTRYQFTRPDNIVTVRISKETGLLPKTSFEETMEEYFIVGTQPTPLSDSLAYNFYPSMFRENPRDSLVIDLGGRRYTWPDSVEYYATYPDTSRPDSVVWEAKPLPKPIDLRGALIYKDKQIVERDSTMLVNKPDSLFHDKRSEDYNQSLYYQLMMQEEEEKDTLRQIFGDDFIDYDLDDD
jgi:penicillin-binding protein 1A